MIVMLISLNNNQSAHLVENHQIKFYNPLVVTITK
jgi:hypothetical protein